MVVLLGCKDVEAHATAQSLPRVWGEVEAIVEKMLGVALGEAHLKNG
jgi:hypothetical protein